MCRPQNVGDVQVQMMLTMGSQAPDLKPGITKVTVNNHIYHIIQGGDVHPEAPFIVCLSGDNVSIQSTSMHHTPLPLPV